MMNLLYHLNKSTRMKSAPKPRVLRAKARSRLQRGIVMPLAAISLLSLLGIAALAIDVGYLFVVRNELQNAADSAALAGAGALVPYTGTPATPNWANAEALANNAISLNRAVNADLVNGQVATGYWDITGNRTELNPEPLDANDLTAVMVTIQRAAGNNGGPVNAFFAQVLGINTFNVPARGVAVRSSPGNTEESLMPIAIAKCMYDNYWDPITNTPKTNETFTIGSTYHYPGCGDEGIAGQWTSFTTNNNDVRTMRTLIDEATGKIINPNPTEIGIGDNIWIQPGTENTLYDNKNQASINACSAAGDRSCEYALIPVICPNQPNCDNLLDSIHRESPVVGFACIHILGAVGGSTKAITIQMVAMGSVSQCEMSDSGGVGPSFGVFQPPKLVNYGNNNLLRW